MIKQIFAIGLVAIVVGAVLFFVVNLPKYENAIVHGTVQNVFQESLGRFGLVWNVNVTLDKGVNGNLGVWHDNPYNVNGQSVQTGPVEKTGYPVKLSTGQWDYLVRAYCDLYKAGDEIYLRIPIYAGGNVWSEPRAVQGYDYHNLSHNYDFPAIYKPSGIGFVSVNGC